MHASQESLSLLTKKLISVSKALPTRLSREQLEKLATDLSIDQSFGILTRNAFQVLIFPKIRNLISTIIFGDIDNLHSLNRVHGYKEMDRKLKVALATRRSDIVLRWFSGDEIVWVLIDGDASVVIQRITAQLARQGLSAVFAFSKVDKFANWEAFERVVERLSKEVMAKKSN